MKKLFLLFLICVMLCGCGSKEEVVETETTTQEETDVERVKIKDENHSVGTGDLHIYAEVDKDGNSYITFSYMTDVEYEAAYAYVLLASLCQEESMQIYNPSCLVMVDDVLLSSFISYATIDGKTELVDAVDWCLYQIEEFNYSEEQRDVLEKEFNDALVDFFDN